MLKNTIIICLIILLIYYYYQANYQPHIQENSPEVQGLIKDLKRQVQHYQKLYEDRIAKDLELEKKEAGMQTDNQGTWTDLTDRQITLLRQQWEQVAQWATEQGIDVNEKWNLGLLKQKLEQENTKLQAQLASQEQTFDQNRKLWQDNLQKKEEELTTSQKQAQNLLTRCQNLGTEKQRLTHGNQQLIKTNQELMTELEQRKNWKEDRIPQLKQELFSQVQNVYQELKEQIKKSTMAWGRKEVNEKLIELEEFFEQKKKKKTEVIKSEGNDDGKNNSENDETPVLSRKQKRKLKKIK